MSSVLGLKVRVGSPAIHCRDSSSYMLVTTKTLDIAHGKECRLQNGFKVERFCSEHGRARKHETESHL